MCAWSDGGYDRILGGTAGFIISLYSRNGVWTTLAVGGVYDGDTRANDSFRMEAIGMEAMLDHYWLYLLKLQE